MKQGMPELNGAVIQVFLRLLVHPGLGQLKYTNLITMICVDLYPVTFTLSIPEMFKVAI